MNLFWRLLCWLNIYHDWSDGWCDDGKGNSGAYAECRTCKKFIEGWEI